MKKKPITISIALVTLAAAAFGGYTIMSDEIGLEVTGPETAAVGELVEFNASGADSYSWVLLPASENQRILGDTLYFSAQRPGLYTFVVSGTREGKVQSKVLNLRIGGSVPVVPEIVDPLRDKLDDWLGNLDPAPVRNNIDVVINQKHETVDDLLAALAQRNRETLDPKYRGFLMKLGVYMELQLAGADLKLHLEFLIQISEALQ